MQANCHMSVLVHEQAKKYGDREMLIYQDFGGKEWKSLSWNQVSTTVKQVSNALLNLGVKVQCLGHPRCYDTLLRHQL